MGARLNVQWVVLYVGEHICPKIEDETVVKNPHSGVALRCCSSAGPHCRTAYPTQRAVSDTGRIGKGW